MVLNILAISVKTITAHLEEVEMQTRTKTRSVWLAARDKYVLTRSELGDAGGDSSAYIDIELPSRRLGHQPRSL